MNRTQKRRELRKRMVAKLKDVVAAVAPATTERTLWGQGIGPDPESATKSMTRSERTLERQAVARGWTKSLTPERLEGIAIRQMQISLDKNATPRDSSRAAAVIVKVVDQVMEQEKRDSGAADDKVQVNVAVTVPAGQSIREVIEHDPQYALYLEQRELGQLGTDGDASVVGQGDHGGGVSDAAAHSDDQPGDHGHHHGNGRH